MTDDANRCKLLTGFYKKEPLKRTHRSRALEIKLKVLLFSAAMDRKPGGILIRSERNMGLGE